MKIRTLRRVRWILHVVTAASLVAIVVVEYAWPWAAWGFYAEEYRHLVVECDQAMHDEVALRQTPEFSDLPPGRADLLRISGDVGLTVCHDYDKLRKRLLIAGVSEYRLALLGLEALEAEEIPVSRMVEPHRMPRF